MKLSEAIRLGAMLKPQAFGPSTVIIGTCAFNAALDAIGIGKRSDCVSKCGEVFPVDLNAMSACPACGERTIVARIVAIHLNDRHHWTRERIADWVETVENAQEAAKEQPVAVEVSR